MLSEWPHGSANPPSTPEKAVPSMRHLPKFDLPGSAPMACRSGSAMLMPRTTAPVSVMKNDATAVPSM